MEERTEPVDLAEIWNLLRKLDNKVDVHLADEADLRPKLIILINILERSKGAITFVKAMAALATVAMAIYAFAASHFTWRP